MKKSNRYELGGIVIEIPVYYDELSGMYLEEYPDFAENPVYTKDGRPLTLSFEDACGFGNATEGIRLIDCSDCKYFQRASDKTLFGVCTNEKNIIE